MLTVLVVYQLVTLRRKLKSGVFGSKLTLRLVLLFALMAVVPGALVYGVSVQFMTRSSSRGSTCAWTRRSKAGSTSAARMLDNMLKDLARKADAMALALSRARRRSTSRR